MNVKCLVVLLALAALSARADDSPAIDLFAGWSWYPYAYGHPYGRPGPDGWLDGAYGAGPYVGLARTWPYAEDPWPYRYGFGPYPYDWGFGYGVRMRVYPGSPLRLPQPGEALLAPVPGSAPTALKDEAGEQAWDADITSFLSGLPTASERLAETNSPPAAR